MGKYRIEHNRPDCIGCAACAAVAPDHWEMNEDGKSDIIGGKRLDTEWEEKEIDDSDFEDNMEAAESCPVNVIHLIRTDNDEKLI